MKRFIISEEERKKILSKYRLINEQIDPKNGGQVKIQNFYKGGFYTLDSTDTSTNEPVKNKLVVELEKVTEFLKLNKDASLVDVYFLSQESSVPNTNEEKAKDYAPFQGRDRVNVGELTVARQFYLQKYINEYFTNLINTGVLSKSFKIPEVRYKYVEPITKFIGQPFCLDKDLKAVDKNDTQGYACMGKDFKVNGSTKNNWYNQKFGIYATTRQKYLDEQRSELTITVNLKPSDTGTTTTVSATTEPTIPECATNLKIQISTPGHKCNNAEFFILANDTKLTNTSGGDTANLNNSDTSVPIPKRGGSVIDSDFLNPAYGKLKNGDDSVPYKSGSNYKNGDIGGVRSDTFIVTEEQSKEIVKSGKEEGGIIRIFMVSTTNNSHKSVPIVTITGPKGETVLDKKKPSVNKGLLLTLNACGTKMITTAPANESLLPKNDVAALRARFVGERVSLQSTGGDELSRKEKRRMDTKSNMLNRTIDMLGAIADLGNFLIDKAKEKKVPMSAKTVINFINNKNNKKNPQYKNYEEYYNEVVPTIQKYYDGFETIIKGDGKEPKLDRPGNLDFLVGETRGGMFKDIRQDLTDFYAAYDVIYKNDKGEINKDGGWNWSSTTIKKALDKFLDSQL